MPNGEIGRIYCENAYWRRWERARSLRYRESQDEIEIQLLVLNDDIQVITTPAKKGKVVEMVATAGQKRARQRRSRKKAARQMKLF